MTARRALPRTVRVVGLPGSGKSTLALRLARRLGVPVLDLDTVVRLPGGVIASPERYRSAVAAFLARSPDGWVVDGDDVDEVGLRYDDAELVVWLDVPPWRCRARVLRRAVVDLLTDSRAWHGGPERWSLLVGRGETARLIRWIGTEHAERSRFYAARLAADPRWVRVRGARGVAAFERACVTDGRAGRGPADPREP